MIAKNPQEGWRGHNAGIVRKAVRAPRACWRGHDAGIVRENSAVAMKAGDMDGRYRGCIRVYRETFEWYRRNPPMKKLSPLEKVCEAYSVRADEALAALADAPIIVGRLSGPVRKLG